MKVLETERLLLRPWRETDIDDFYEYTKNPNIGPNAGWAPHLNKEVSRAILGRFIEDDDTWAVTLKETGKAIGSIGLHEEPIRKLPCTRMLGYVLSEPYWGRGYMTEAVKSVIKFAFADMGLELLSVFHFTFNERSKRVIEKAGFTFEGTLRMATTTHDGKVADRCCYSMTAREFFANMNISDN